jgi:hypothetical protein
MNMNLAGETYVVIEISFHGQSIALELAHLARIAGENFDTAGGAASVPATAMQNVDSPVLEDEYQLLSFGRLNGLSAGCSYGFDIRHWLRLRKLGFDCVVNLAQEQATSKRRIS